MKKLDYMMQLLSINLKQYFNKSANTVHIFIVKLYLISYKSWFKTIGNGRF